MVGHHFNTVVCICAVEKMKGKENMGGFLLVFIYIQYVCLRVLRCMAEHAVSISL